MKKEATCFTDLTYKITIILIEFLFIKNRLWIDVSMYKSLNIYLIVSSEEHLFIIVGY